MTAEGCKFFTTWKGFQNVRTKVCETKANDGLKNP